VTKPKTLRLAVDGGEPVRSKPFGPRFYGTSVYGAEELELVREVIERKLPFREYGAGEPHMVKDFESAVREYFDVPYALATSTGSGSFYCATAGLGIGPGDEVIIPAFGWFTDFNAVALMGATPIFGEVDRSLNLDPEDVERKITDRTKAVITVHFQGASNDLDRLLEVTRPRGIKVIEDCAQSCGASFKGRKLGTIGDVGCFSFQQNKIMSTGDGGMMVTGDGRVFERAARYHDLGTLRGSLGAQLGGEPQESPFVGSQFRMNELTGAVGLAQLRKLDEQILRVTRGHHKYVRERVQAECEGLKLRAVGDAEGDAGIAFYMDLETAEQARWFMRALEAEGIPAGPASGCTNLLETALVQKKLMHHPGMPPFGKGWGGEHIEYRPEMCPKTLEIVPCMVCVALAPTDSADDVKDIADAIVKVWNNRPEEG